jgi:hypothetical protein
MGGAINHAGKEVKKRSRKRERRDRVGVQRHEYEVAATALAVPTDEATPVRTRDP